jgi:hypothetical protein
VNNEREHFIRDNRLLYPELYEELLRKNREKKKRYKERVKQDPIRKAAYKAKDKPYQKAWEKKYKQTEKGKQAELRQEKRHRERQYDKREFVAVDGEGWDIPKNRWKKAGKNAGKHVLTVLGSSIQPAIYNPFGIPTYECLEYLLSLAAKGRTLVGYSFSYDVNMILADLSHSAIEELCAEHWASFHGPNGEAYRIKYTPRKSLYITKGVYEYNEWKKVKSVVIWDTFGFFQSSFLEACKQWGVISEEEIDLIEKGKRGRGSFDETQADEIIRYNDLECELLVKLMGEVKSALTDCGIRLSRWDGAGAIANALHVIHNTKQHKPTTPQPDDIILRAFYGARVQMLRVGEHTNVWGHDINSAYPSTICDLPSLAGGEWVEVSEYDSLPDCAIWEVEWNVGVGDANPHYPLTPFPWRTPEKTIRYPSQARGVYWATLVRVAKEGWGDKVRVLRGWVFHPTTDEKPFAWVRDLYELRKVCRDTGKGKVLKLGYNSLYGKFAQGVGYHENKPPAYQNYTWAGMITAHCQARVLQAALQAPKDVIAIATDGVFCCSRLNLPESKELGEWEIKPSERFLIFQPGVYVQWKNGEPYKRTRGFSPKELPLEALVNGWQERKALLSLKLQVTRFVGMHLACHQGKLDTEWRQWITRERVLAPAAGSTIPEHYYSEFDPKDWGQSITCYPEELRDDWVGVLPTPYKPKGQINLDPEQHEQHLQEADQP